MPKSKLKWKRTEGRIGPAWRGTDQDLTRHVPKGFKFHTIEWFGTRYVILWVSV